MEIKYIPEIIDIDFGLKKKKFQFQFLFRIEVYKKSKNDQMSWMMIIDRRKKHRIDSPLFRLEDLLVSSLNLMRSLDDVFFSYSLNTWAIWESSSWIYIKKGRKKILISTKKVLNSYEYEMLHCNSNHHMINIDFD